MITDHGRRSQEGFTFAEVMVAMAITSVTLVGTVATFHVAEQHLREGTVASRALALVESRIEAKQSARWDRLLIDDLNHDGQSNLIMRDEGEGDDALAGDGVYSGSWDDHGIHLRWTVTLSRPGALSTSGSVLLEAIASYMTDRGPREVRMSTLRANPTFVGFN
ncbi:MAG TPA: choice-of-anchor X domain-containing protein [Nitrospiraceae bacterium]|nr:choice-of-anchor X domain-containing protein [Nitrospiraceae bacterium]